MQPRKYRYVGPEEHARDAHAAVDRLQPASSADLLAWLTSRRVQRTTVTFVIDVDGQLWISDRGIEHIVCARGGPVLSAGELELSRHGAAVRVDSVTNQSTGFCPEPESWPVVARALRASGLTAPDGFTHAFNFRRCQRCATKNLLKPEYPDCPVCGAQLPARWNFD